MERSMCDKFAHLELEYRHRGSGRGRVESRVMGSRFFVAS